MKRKDSEMQEVEKAAQTTLDRRVLRQETTTCCIVGGEPARVMLALLGARKGVVLQEQS